MVQQKYNLGLLVSILDTAILSGLASIQFGYLRWMGTKWYPTINAAKNDVSNLDTSFPINGKMSANWRQNVSKNGSAGKGPKWTFAPKWFFVSSCTSCAIS